MRSIPQKKAKPLFFDPAGEGGLNAPLSVQPLKASGRGTPGDLRHACGRVEQGTGGFQGN
jgi:hypothetical protein